ncbi:MAG TPA: EamA family transporter [Acidimicrobiales bacterium]|nr:EamA family transporter [Acidimicrobiales bacterium]
MSRRGQLLFLAMGLIWGIPYLLIKVAVRELTVPQLVFARTAPAALLLVPLAWRRGYLRPLCRQWRAVLLYTAVEVAGPWFLLSSAEKRLSSSVSGLLIAMVPLIGAGLVLVTGQGNDRLDRRRLVGLLVGIAGVAALVGVDLRGNDLLAVGEVALTALGYAAGPMIISRRFADLPGLGLIAASFALTAAGYAPFALAHPVGHLSLEVVGAVATLTLVCTTVAFLLFFALIVEVGPARATVITYVNPAVAVALGVVLLGEPFTAGIALGFPLILAGSYLATRATRPALTPAVRTGRPSG